MRIYLAKRNHHQAIWRICKPIIRAGETYPYPPDMKKQAVLALWTEPPHTAYVAEVDQQIVGTYYLKPNQPELGAHVCNAGYMVDPLAQGQGIGLALCEHSQQEAKKLGYLSMQFNLVVSTNHPSVHLWKKMGFETVGSLSKAFQHPQHGLVDAYVMYKWLGD